MADDLKGYFEDAIWGHRIHDEQFGVMNLLEFLCVVRGIKKPENSDSAEKEKLTLDADGFFAKGEKGVLGLSFPAMYLPGYTMQKQICLRSLVFDNPYIDEIPDNDLQPWENWEKKYSNAHPEAVKGISRYARIDSLEKLKAIFPGKSDIEQFRNFRNMIRLLRRSAINADSNKRWGSKFIFPWGPDCLHSDMDNNGDSDRRFFARNGEVLYLLLSKTTRFDDMITAFKTRFIAVENEMNMLCRLLQRNEKKTITTSDWTAYIPDDLTNDDLALLNRLCDDLICVLKLPIPTVDIVEHLSRLIELGLLRYFLRRGYQELYSDVNADARPFEKNIFLCEMLTRKTSNVRRVSRYLHTVNQEQSANAVAHMFEAKKADIQMRETDDSDPDDGEEQPTTLKAAVMKNHGHHWGKIHSMFARDVGLSSKYWTNAYRYAPNDELLQTLVLAVVKGKRMLLSDFLHDCYMHYGIVIREPEYILANIKNPDWRIDSNSFKHNLDRLKTRLSALGLLVSLSDGCEFVMNPYQ